MQAAFIKWIVKFGVVPKSFVLIIAKDRSVMLGGRTGFQPVIPVGTASETVSEFFVKPRRATTSGQRRNPPDVVCCCNWRLVGNSHCRGGFVTCPWLDFLKTSRLETCPYTVSCCDFGR
jgi:hypothetical protein